MCGYEKEFLEMTKAIKSFVPNATVTGNDGKEGNLTNIVSVIFFL